MHKVLKIGKIYRGKIQKVIDFGLFIKVEIAQVGGRRGSTSSYEGLVHVSQIRYGR